MKLPFTEDFIAFEINENELIAALREIQPNDCRKAVNGYLKLCKILLLSGKTLGEYLHDTLIFSEQPLVQKYVKDGGKAVFAAIEYDVGRIKDICCLEAGDIKKYLSHTFNRDFSPLPEYEKGTFDFDAEYFTEHYRENGGGIFARYKAFTYFKEQITPVENHDPIRVSQLKRYEVQRGQIIDNTICFISGKPAHNVLLYGDRGTGKSSTIKAMLNEYDTLRMIQLDKNQVSSIFELYGKLSQIPLYFIIFIDDLCFSEDDDGFFMMKQALEGSLAAKPDNVLIYATTNRRHIIKETAANRADNFVHKSDAIDDNMSLSERFGLFITFSAPNKDQFADIARGIAADRGINLNDDAFTAGLERFALKRGGRSPRIAKQYVDMLEGKLSLGLNVN